MSTDHASRALDPWGNVGSSPAPTGALDPWGGIGSSPAPTSSEVVLVVDDDWAVRMLVRHALQAFGYTILEAGSADEALKVAGAHHGRIDLLLADIRMPGGGGGTLAATMTTRRPSIRVLLMSGYYDASIGRGANDTAPFLPKPFSPSDLVRTVRQVLNCK